MTTSTQENSTVATTTNSPSSVDFILSAQWWKDSAPSLSVDDSRFRAAPPLTLNSASVDAIKQLIVREGYMQGNVGKWNLPIPEMSEVVVKLRQAGLMPVFALVYEEFWLLAWQLKNVVSAALGNDYYVLPDFWIWHVDPKQDESGWKPHRDKGRVSLQEDGSPKSVTMWIPLTAATPLNGCMYVVPADRDPTYGSENEKDWKFAYQDIRALPAVPGDFFMWNQAVLHWGSHASPRGGEARISIAFEFQRADVPPMNRPLLPSNGLPSFEDRLRLIGKQVLQYQHMYPLSPELAALAKRMASL